MKPLIEHEAIRASAGSGKTFQLAHRYIRLLAHGIEPSRIIAITFSRKAAGEIFTAIVSHLCTAASSEQEAAATAQRIGISDLSAPTFLDMLQRFLNSLQRMHISTIDSFTIGICRLFPMELGIAPAFDVMNGTGLKAEQARAQAWQQLFRHTRHIEGEQALLEAFKQATHGKETKSFSRELDLFIAEHQQAYQLLPDSTAWGQPNRIWPDGNPWLAQTPDLTRCIAALREHIQKAAWDPYAQNKWEEFLSAVSNWHAGLPWQRIAYLGDRLLAEREDLQQGHIDLKINRTTYSRSGPPAEWMWALVRHVMRECISSALHMTQGIHALLHQFETVYDREVRRPGLLTFDDAQFLILQGGRTLSRTADAVNRLHIDYRLDSQLDHWLIDEFQDTSDLQWAVLNNLADEVIQDATGTRSFFFVGDVKQAIYGWRGGNHKLFAQLLSTYGDRIHTRPLNTSFRSAQPVLELVNASFTTLPEDLPDAVRTQWSALWEPHQCRTDSPPPPGYAALLEAGDELKQYEATYDATASLLRSLDPLRRGLTVGILVRRNATAQAVANALRTACPDMPVAIEGESAVADNPVVRLLCSLIHYAAHPGDTLAREHLRMSPLGPRVFDGRHAPARLLAQLYEDGYQAFLRQWSRHLHEAHPLDDFGHYRLTALLDAAGEFDGANERQPDAFVAFIREYTFPEQAADSTVRVMTVHKSKGLGFDIVIVPDLAEGNALTTIKDRGIHIARDQHGRPDWALLMPVKTVRWSDAVLATEEQQRVDDGCFENLCGLYVALTRAKRGLYLITTPPPKSKSKTLTYAAYLREQLTGCRTGTAAKTASAPLNGYGVLYESGDRNWFTESPLTAEATPTDAPRTPPSPSPRGPSRRRRLLHVSPSAQAEEKRPIRALFAPHVNRSLDLGTSVHALFEQLEWSDRTDADTAIALCRARSMEPDEEATAHFRQALHSPAFQEALARPDGDAICWRERAFEAVIDNEWVTGTFDRVVVVRDDSGAVTRSIIQDFKTNDVPDEAAMEQAVEHYRPQLNLYAKALSKLLRHPVEDLSAQLLFTRPGQVITVF